MNQDYQNHYKVIAPLIMCSGVGDGKTTACVMAQAATINALRQGKTLDAPTDEMDCACPVLRRMAIKVNDANWWKDDLERTELLRPLIPLLLDSLGSDELGWRRVWLIVDRVVRDLTPMRLDWISEHSRSSKVKESNSAGAKQLRELPPIVDRESCKSAREICSSLQKSSDASACACAYASASAYADAGADASSDAGAYASASAYAYAYSSAYADAGSDAGADAGADAQTVKYRTAYLKLFRDVADLK